MNSLIPSIWNDINDLTEMLITNRWTEINKSTHRLKNTWQKFTKFDNRETYPTNISVAMLVSRKSWYLSKKSTT